MRRFWILPLLALLLCACSENGTEPTQPATETVTITDALGRSVTIPKVVERVICSGPGCLRYLTYLRAQDRAIAVDSIEKRKTRIDARPYAMTNPQFKKLPLFGEFRGRDNPELIAALDPQPQVIFKTYSTSGHDPEELQAKTGIPVVCLDYGDLGLRRDAVYESLTLMGMVLGVEQRAEEVIGFLKTTIADLAARTEDVSERPTCFVGGIAFKGPHGFRSTEPGYPPFLFLNAANVAAPESGKPPRHADATKEQIVTWNPEYIFVDLSTIRAGAESNSLYELANDEAYKHLTANREGRVFGVLPYNWYTSNHGNTLADAYFIGKTLYPERFEDIDPVSKADSIYTFLVGGPVFDELSKAFGNLAFTKLDASSIRIGDDAEVLEQ
ncbi:iron ABC transporter substrate-binding protein [Salidesulfovibrio brasiliensis]|uniref:iron ABC transporter substrate-binding protein n=1 Tax=Salidesulfovibrio brasiliensis TaxID=221711 RepID=UPI0006D1DB9B|nr:iron ABC transporter substrate-binding protein [Salidesulfovibrio brasiliensis]